MVMANVTVGENAVVGAMSFVNKDVPDNAVVIGVPAKIKERKRFNGRKEGQNAQDKFRAK